MDLISRTRNRVLVCFHKSFSHLKVKNLNVPLRKFFRFFYFVPHDRNYNPSNFCTIRTIFDRERAQKRKRQLFKILRQSPLKLAIFLMLELILIPGPIFIIFFQNKLTLLHAFNNNIFLDSNYFSRMNYSQGAIFEICIESVHRFF